MQMVGAPDKAAAGAAANTVRKSLAISFAERYSALVLQFVSTVIIARLLTPAEIGVFSVAAVLTTLAHTLRDFGVGQYVIQEKALTTERLRAAYGVAIASAWVVAAALAALSAPAAWFYHAPGVGRVMRVFALNFVLLPFGSVSLALWRREMNFAAAYYIKISGGLVQAATSIALAFAGFSYMSLAWGAAAGIAVTVVAAHILRPPNMPWLPAASGLRGVLSFGGMTSSAVLVKDLGAGAPDLILGRVLGMGPVGIYARAVGLVQLFERYVSSAVLGVMLPHLAAKQRGGEALKEPYLRALTMVTGIAWPFLGVLALQGVAAVRLLYGPQWGASVPVVKVLCAGAAVNVLSYFAGQALLAAGAPRTNMALQFVVQPATVAFELVAARFGLVPLALAASLGALTGFFVSTRFLHRHIGLTFGDVGRATGRSAALALFAMAGPAALSLVQEGSGTNVAGPFALAILGAAMGWGIGLFALSHPLKSEVLPVVTRLRRLTRLSGT